MTIVPALIRIESLNLLRSINATSRLLAVPLLYRGSHNHSTYQAVPAQWRPYGDGMETVCRLRLAQPIFYSHGLYVSIASVLRNLTGYPDLN